MVSKVPIPGKLVKLRPVSDPDLERVVEMRSHPQIKRWWRGEDFEAEFRRDLADEELHQFAIESQRAEVIGLIQYFEEPDPQYRHAGVDLYIDPAHQRQGYGHDAINTLVGYLRANLGHHRVVIDPAADNSIAIACYSKAGFERVGLMRRYELGADAEWHDGLLMELVFEP